MDLICKAMGVSRSGYYSWKKREIAGNLTTRDHVIKLVTEIHEKHRTHGYRWVNAYIRDNHNEIYSDNYIYKVFRYLGIQAETRHKVKRKPRKIIDRYPNLIFTTWETVDRPRQVIVSDMTMFKIGEKYYELTMYFDVFTKEILSWNVGSRRGDRQPYIQGMQEIIELLDSENTDEPTIVHTDQGSVYSSKAYNRLIEDKNIERSMSRAGKPTDNPVNESLNGWIKEELFVDFRLSESKDVVQTISEYVVYYNTQRPCYAIGYNIPSRFYKQFMNGEIDRKYTFADRVLTEEPKFVRKKREKESKNKCYDLSH